MKKLLFIVSFLILFTTQALAVTVGSVMDKMGQTWNERDGRTEEVIKGYLLEMNDFLQTGEDGGMILHYKDETKFTMGPNTELIIDEFAFDTSVIPIEIAMNISINVGTFTYESGDVKKLGGEVEIVTPTATITMQGTAFSGLVDTSGVTTITLLPDSHGNVGQVTVTNEAGSQILTNVYTSVTVVGSDIMIKTPSPLGHNEKRNLFNLDSIEVDIEDKKDIQFDRKENNEFLENEKEEFESNELLEQESKDVEMDAKEAQEIEEQIISEELSIESDTTASDATVEIIDDFTTQSSELDTKSTEDITIDDGSLEESDIDTSYYDEWEDDLKDWGYIDDDNQISVWDGEGEQTMDWDDAKQMYAEMDQAYFDAIGCSDCTWDSVNWDSIDWDEVNWDAYMEEYNDLLEDYGLTSYETEVEDKSTEVEEEATSTTVGYTWEDFDLSDDYYNNADYIAAGGPPTLTTENYCNYNGYSSDWCNQEYLDYLNGWYQDDWSLYKDFTTWTKDAKALFEKWYGWCGTYPNWEWCDGQPKPWTIPSLKDKYVADWQQEDWNNYFDNQYNWWYYGEYEEETEDSWEDEYAYEDDYDIDAELELWLAEIDNEDDCVNWGYYWNKAASSCGTEWVDNSGSETTVTTSGEVINYTTGEITQTTTSELTGSSTQTGRYTTGSNTYDADIDTSVSGYSIINRYNDNHRAYLKIETADEADVQIVQDSEAQHLDVGSSSSQQNITIIQTD
jgi:hypothetical protein